MFRDKSGQLMAILDTIKRKKYGKPISPTIENETEKKYKKYNYNGSFHKGLEHNTVDGRLVSTLNYQKMVCAIIKNDQSLLASIPLAVGSTVKLVNPLASLCTLPMGAMQGSLQLEDAPTLWSNTGAAEMVELYAQVLARDIPFVDYNTSVLISKLLGNQYLNKPNILQNLKYIPASINHPFTSNTIFRSNFFGGLDGPYVSQLLLLDVVAGALRYNQQFSVPPTKVLAITNSIRVEWGVSLAETINMQNGKLALLPPATPVAKLIKRYIFDGRSLAEAVHNDPVYQFYYHATLILSSLGTSPNPTWPVYPNQGGFITNNGPAAVQCLLADVTEYTLKHSWYWKWQQSRKLRPEAFGLWTHDVKSNLVPNADNFDISNVLLDNKILDDILAYNNEQIPGTNSYTMAQAYREGSPLHPAYVSGHAIIAGACATILKMFYNGNQLWTTLPGVISGNLSGLPNAIVQANVDGTQLISFAGQTTNITVAGELNKLAFNVGIGRDWAGIHYRTDAYNGILLGETVAIKYMSDVLACSVENNTNGSAPEIIFKNFDNQTVTVRPTTCL